MLSNGLASPVYTGCTNTTMSEHTIPPDKIVKKIRVGSYKSVNAIEFKDNADNLIFNKDWFGVTWREYTL